MIRSDMIRPHSTPLSPVPRRLAALALVAGSCLPLAQASDPLPHTTPAMQRMRVALQRDLGLDARQLARRLDAEQHLLHEQHDARRRFGADFAGAWIEQGPNGETRAVVATTRRGVATRLPGLHADVRLATYSIATLDAALARLGKPQHPPARNTGTRVDPAIRAWYVDVPRNRIVVEIAPGADALTKARAFLATAAIDPRMVTFTVTAARPATTSYVLRGGEPYQSGTRNCTIGFPIRWEHGGGFLTAGHCGPRGTAAYRWAAPHIGYVQASTFPGADHGWVRRDNTNWSETNQIAISDTQHIPIVGNHEAPLGSGICRTGRDTKHQCGTVLAKGVQVNYPEGVVYGLTSTSACSAPGDSGGPFYTVRANYTGVEAQGITSGRDPGSVGNNCNTVFQKTYFQPVVPALAENGLTLITEKGCGRLNAGGVLTAGASIFSCNGRYQLIQQGDGNLVLYKVGVRALWWNEKFGANHVTRMQGDGNLVTYNANNQWIWQTHTYVNHGAALFLMDSGNLVIYSAQGAKLWQTNTANL